MLSPAVATWKTKQDRYKIIMYNNHIMQKKKKRRVIIGFVFGGIAASIGIIILGIGGWIYWFSQIRYKDAVYPAVYINGIPFDGKTQKEVEAYWMAKNKLFENVTLTLTFEDHVATLASDLLELGYDATLSATQAYLIGRSPYFWANIDQQFFKKKIDLPPVFQWNKEAVNTNIQQLSSVIDVSPQDALFQFENGKVTSFKPSTNGRAVNKKEVFRLLEEAMPHIAAGNLTSLVIPIPVDTIYPNVTTDKVNSLGIKDKIGTGYSEFSGSIPGRIHNVLLAASKLNGVLIKPGETFSFNATVGDISAATGYQSAYIIKDGHTVMGDGGGVCQVSTTLFRAALAAGLPIVERHEHSYRVHYYEEGGFKAGIDATVYHPTDDLKFKNDTPGYILIQTSHDLSVPSLTFEFYGTSDGRKAEILNHKVWGITPPPQDLYQDDPTLSKGTIKQVDFAAWGAKASFDYQVVRNGTVINEQTFSSNYRPWQAVYLRGTKE